MSPLRTCASLVLLAVAVSACRSERSPAPSPAEAPTPPPPPPLAIERIPATSVTSAEASEDSAEFAERDRRMRAVLTFDEFRSTVYHEPFEGGKFIVNGDTVIANEKQLREFYDQKVKVQPHEPTALVLHQITGMDVKWGPQQKIKLSYCVSNAFGSRHSTVVKDMANAAGAWEQAAAIDFTHDTAQDASCGPSNQSVVFDVRPVDGGEYLARAFFPNEPRPARNVLIDESSFDVAPGEQLQLVGILRHELGHTLGFRHEHTRPEAGTCFEDNDWRPLTNYDALSVMHYPQCNGKGDWSLNLTPTDRSAVACAYGPAKGFTIDSTLVTGPCATNVSPTGPSTTQSFAGQAVARNAMNSYGPFAVAAGSQLDVSIGGATASGDPDLYLRFDAQPTVRRYQCRPYLDGPVEACSVTVPAAASRVFVAVRGYTEGKYDLQITVAPAVPPSVNSTK
jgi:serine protease